MSVQDERALIKRAQTSASGFGELFDAYYARIYAYAYRRVGARDAAEDVAANVFEDALRGIKRLRWQNRPIAAWLYRIAQRRVADYFRNLQSNAPLEESAREADDDVDDALERDGEYASLRRALEQLDRRDRELIQLVFFDELNSVQVAAILDCTLNNVYVRTHRALKKLQAILRDNWD